jgi:hypothetical protein
MPTTHFETTLPDPKANDLGRDSPLNKRLGNLRREIASFPMAEQITDAPRALPYRDDLFAGRTELRVSEHALREAHKEGIRAKDIIYLVLTGEVIERYPNRRRILVSGRYRDTDLNVHVVCDYSDPIEVVVTTVYIPTRSRWRSFRRRRHH